MSEAFGNKPGTAAADIPLKEPWHGRLLAMTISLSEEGHFTWSEWTQVFANQLRSCSLPDDADDVYYQCWLVALEALLTGKRFVETDRVDDLAGRWADAYRHTPHGHPVHVGSAQ